MTKEEAIQEMRAGKKVTHRYFTQEEWVTMGQEGQTRISFSLTKTKEEDKTKSTLEDQMQSALKQERFEEAAVLRDAINKLAEVNAKNQSKK